MPQANIKPNNVVKDTTKDSKKRKFKMPSAFSILFGIVALVNKLFRNALSPILVTLFGIVIFVKLVQPLNALSPILVTLSGIVTLVKFLQEPKA